MDCIITPHEFLEEMVAKPELRVKTERAVYSQMIPLDEESFGENCAETAHKVCTALDKGSGLGVWVKEHLDELVAAIYINILRGNSTGNRDMNQTILEGLDMGLTAWPEFKDRLETGAPAIYEQRETIRDVFRFMIYSEIEPDKQAIAVFYTLNLVGMAAMMLMLEYMTGHRYRASLSPEVKALREGREGEPMTCPILTPFSGTLRTSGRFTYPILNKRGEEEAERMCQALIRGGDKERRRNLVYTPLKSACWMGGIAAVDVALGSYLFDAIQPTESFFVPAVALLAWLKTRDTGEKQVRYDERWTKEFGNDAQKILDAMRQERAERTEFSSSVACFAVVDSESRMYAYPVSPIYFRAGRTINIESDDSKLRRGRIILDPHGQERCIEAVLVYETPFAMDHAETALQSFRKENDPTIQLEVKTYGDVEGGNLQIALRTQEYTQNELSRVARYFNGIAHSLMLFDDEMQGRLLPLKIPDWINRIPAEVLRVDTTTEMYH